MTKQNFLKHVFLSVILLVSFVILPLSAGAVEKPFYIGAGYGMSDMDTGINSLTGTARLDEEDSGFKIFAGYRFTDFFGLEFGYADLGESSLTGNTGDTFILNNTNFVFLADNVKLVTESYAIPIFGVVYLPLEKVTGNDMFKYVTPFIKVGGYYWESEYTVTASGLNGATTDEDGFDAAFGIGLEINIIKSISIRGEWERFNGDDEADFFSGSLIFKF